MNDVATKCDKCGGPFIAGQSISGHETSTWHTTCPDPQDLSSRIASMVSRWFGEPVIAVEDEIAALIRDEVLAARIDELANSFREFSKDVPFDERLAYYDSRNESLRTKVEQLTGKGDRT